MTKADEIRRLAQEGLSTAEIARKVGIRYQHAYHVLARSGLLPGRSPAIQRTAKPSLLSADLLAAGFSLAGPWRADEEGGLIYTEALPKEPGVYAFALGETVQYVGLASMGLTKRLRFYARPGKTQRTSLRLNAKLLELLSQGKAVDLLWCCPEELEWNGLPVHGAAGLEMGLIKTYTLPWNIRGAG